MRVKPQARESSRKLTDIIGDKAGNDWFHGANRAANKELGVAIFEPLHQQYAFIVDRAAFTLKYECRSDKIKWNIIHSDLFSRLPAAVVERTPTTKWD